MPGPSSGYLPPIVAELTASASDALTKIEGVKLALGDLSKTPTDVTITADGARALAVALATRNAIAAQPPITFSIGINSAEALAALNVAHAIAGAFAESNPITFPITADAAPLLADMAVIKASAAAGGAMGGGIGAIFTLLWGRGGFANFAKFGSLASVAGLGFEHLMMTALGLAGSLAGALAGGALLAFGALSKLAVGMGSDMLVMSSTIADTRTLGAALTAIQTAQLTYGKNSAQAAAATQALNVQMLMLGNTAGVKAELGLARMAQALNSYWDRATSAARVAAVGFITPFFTVAYTYIPLIAQAAARNFGIMTKAFAPLIAWANGPATAIFKNLENLFAASIPTGVHALTQFVELLAKVANFAAPQSGSLLVSIDKFLTGLNTTSGFAKLEGVLTTMIGMFRDWWNLLKQVGITIYDLFSQSVGLGTKIVTTITGMLKQLDAWLTSTSGKAAVHNLFAVHLQEVMALLGILPTLAGAFGQLYLMIAPKLTLLVVAVAGFVGWLLKIPGVGQILAWGLAIGILVNTMKLLTIGKWVVQFGQLAFSIAQGAVSFVGFAASGGLASAAATALGVAIDFALGPVGLIIGAIALVAVGLVLLFTHMKQVTDFLHSGWGTAFQIALAVILPFIGIPLLIVTHWNQVVGFFQKLPGWIMQELGKLPGQLLTFFSRIPGAMWTALTKGLPLVLGWFLGLAGKILGALAGLAGTLLGAAGKGIAGFVKGLVGALPTILAWFIKLPFWILAQVVGAAWWLIQTGVKVITGFLGGVGHAAPGIWHWFTQLPGWILSHIVGAAKWLWNTGISILTGLLGGIGHVATSVWSWLTTNFPGNILKAFKDAGTWLFNIGKAVLQGLWNGIKNVWSSFTGWLGGIGNSIVGFFKHSLGIHSPSTVMHDIGQNIMLGLQMGLAHGVDGVMGVMVGMAAQLKNSVNGGKLSVSAQANSTILHSLAAGLPASSTAMGASALPTAGGVAGGGSQSLSIPISLSVTVPSGTPASVAQQIGAATQVAVNKAVYQAVRQMKGGARTYGFMPT